MTNIASLLMPDVHLPELPLRAASARFDSTACNPTSQWWGRFTGNFETLEAAAYTRLSNFDVLLEIYISL